MIGRATARALVSLLVAALASGPVACDDSEPGGQPSSGGAITIAQTAQPDYLDPALGYTVNSWEPLWLVYTPPVTYRRAEGAAGTELIPGLAEQLPEISEDGKTVRFNFRRGLRYSDGSPLKASDFEHTIKRVLMLESGATPFYLAIEGAERYLNAGDADGDISGIETNDQRREVTIRLTARDGTILNVLAMNFSGVVPGDTAFEPLSKQPPPGIGPYKVTESVPNRQFVLERNRRFDVPGVPKGRLDRITTKIVTSQERQVNMINRGELDYMVDPPPPDSLAQIRARYADRYEEHATPSTFYFFMNLRVPPFDQKAVRQAVNYAIDSRAVARLFGGLMEPTCNFLPPGLPGHQEIDPCLYGDPAQAGDLDRARELIRSAGAEGQAVTVWTNTDQVAASVGVYLEDLLDQIGLDARLETVDPAVYFQTIGSQRTGAAIGFANWFQDFPHPANFLFLLDGESIQPTNNVNFGNVDDAQLNRLIDEVRSLLAPEARHAAVAADRRIIDEAFIAPYGVERAVTFVSERMDIENCSRFHPVYHNDYSSFCLK